MDKSYRLSRRGLGPRAQYQPPWPPLRRCCWLPLSVVPSLHPGSAMSLPCSPSQNSNNVFPLTVGLGYLKFLAPPERVLRWIEGKLNLLGRLPHYVSIDQKTYGRYGVLPTTAPTADHAVPMTYMGSTQRLGANPA